jgi:hypothetical protein
MKAPQQGAACSREQKDAASFFTASRARKRRGDQDVWHSIAVDIAYSRSSQAESVAGGSSISPPHKVAVGSGKKVNASSLLPSAGVCKRSAHQDIGNAIAGYIAHPNNRAAKFITCAVAVEASEQDAVSSRKQKDTACVCAPTRVSENRCDENIRHTIAVYIARPGHLLPEHIAGH